MRPREGIHRASRSRTSSGRQDPLIYFVHVPKTAGSSLNAMLDERFEIGQDHIESLLHHPSTLRGLAKECDWMSGHLPRPEALQQIARATDRPIRLFSCVREPGDQLRSHFNWLLEIRCRSEKFFHNHPPVAVEASDFIASRGTRTTDDIVAALERFPRLFRNVQSSVVIGRRIKWDEDEYGSILDTYEAVATDGGLGQLFKAMTGREPVGVKSVNRSTYHFDPKLFEHDDLAGYLLDYNLKDYLFYDLVQRRQVAVPDPTD